MLMHRSTAVAGVKAVRSGSSRCIRRAASPDCRPVGQAQTDSFLSSVSASDRGNNGLIDEPN